MTKKIIILILVAILVVISMSTIFIVSEYNKADGNFQILLLFVDKNETTSGSGTVAMAFVVPMVNYDTTNITPVYPGGMYHPTITTPAEVKAESGATKLPLNDTLLINNTDEGVKLAQEIVEYNTGMKTNAVVIMTPTAVKSMIAAVGPIYVHPIGDVNSSSLDYLITEENLEKNKGSSLNLVMMALMATYHDPSKRPALLAVVTQQYLEGNIIPIPQNLFVQLGIASARGKLV